MESNARKPEMRLRPLDLPYPHPGEPGVKTALQAPDHAHSGEVTSF